MRRLVLLAAVALAASLACTERPDPPERTNPFDPGGLSGGDPFQLTAKLTGSAVDLNWNDIALPGHLGYTVYRSHDVASVVSNPDTILVVGHDSSGFRDENPIHGSSSAYVVTVLSALGEETLRSQAAPVELELGPHIEIRTGEDEASFFTDSRHVKVRVSALGATGVLLSNAIADSELVDPESVPYTGASIDWELTRNPPDTTFSRIVRARVVYGDDSMSAVIADTILTRNPPVQIWVDSFTDSLALAGRRTVTVSFHLAVASPLPPPGADSIEVTLSPPFTGAWQPFPDSTSGYAVEVPLEGPGLDTLYARVMNDIGHIGIDSMLVRADSLEGGVIVLNNSPFPGEVPTTRRDRVNVHVVGVDATEICLSNQPVPPCFEFAPLDSLGRVEWMLEGPGDRTVVVYAILANEWRPEGGGVLLDSIEVESDSLLVRIRPPGTLEVTLGDTTRVSGIARRRTFGPEIAIEVFAGGEPLEVETTPATAADTVDAFWSALWTAPDTLPADPTAAQEAGKVIARIRDEGGDTASDSLAFNLSPPGVARGKVVAPRVPRRARAR